MTEEERGQWAAQVLSNPEFKASLPDVRMAILDAIAQTKPQDSDMREFLYASVRTIPFIEAVLQARLSGGIHAMRKRLAEETEHRKVFGD